MLFCCFAARCRVNRSHLYGRLPIHPAPLPLGAAAVVGWPGLSAGTARAAPSPSHPTLPSPHSLRHSRARSSTSCHRSGRLATVSVSLHEAGQLGGGGGRKPAGEPTQQGARLRSQGHLTAQPRQNVQVKHVIYLTSKTPQPNMNVLCASRSQASPPLSSHNGGRTHDRPERGEAKTQPMIQQKQEHLTITHNGIGGSTNRDLLCSTN